MKMNLTAAAHRAEMAWLKGMETPMHVSQFFFNSSIMLSDNNF